MILIGAVLIILITSFFCSLSEAAVLSLGRARVETLAGKNRSGLLLKKMKENLERPIAAILILNTVANTGGAAFAGREYERIFGGAHMGLFTFGLTVAVLLFSEFIPKALGVRFSERAAMLVARPLQAIVLVLRPLTWLLTRAGRALGVSKRGAAPVSLDDLRAMARLAASANILGREELMIIEGAARLPRVLVNQIMVHRDDIVFVSLADEDDKIIVDARRSQHSRLPLCRNGIDDILGLVSMKEVLWELADDPELRSELKRVMGEAMRDPLFVEPNLDVSDLIQLFARHHEHMAIVREKTGRVVGIVTLEDIVEELMGEIDDEYDRAPNKIEALGPAAWRLGGGALWGDVQTRLGLPKNDFPADLDGRVDINDLAARRLRGRLRTGASFVLGGWAFRVTRMRRGKVLFAEAEPAKSPPESASTIPKTAEVVPSSSRA